MLSDERTRVSLAIDVAGSIRGQRLVEVLSKRFRDECLSMEWFRSRPEAVALIEKLLDGKRKIVSGCISGSPPPSNRSAIRKTPTDEPVQ